MYKYISLVLMKGHKADFSSNRLKSGSGISCLWLLDRLADEGIKTKNHVWKR